MKPRSDNERTDRRGLALVGIAMLVVGIVWIGIALDPRPEARVAPDFRPFAAVVGVATAMAGGLTIRRIRDDAVVSIIGGLTAASFTVATALLTRPETKWTVYSASVVFAALLFGVLMFRRGFARRDGAS